MTDQPRFYPLNGKHFPSVTTMLSIIRKPELEHWRGKVGNEAADQIAGLAADLGTLVHQVCADYARGEFTVRAPPEIDPIFQAYREWFDSTVEQVVAIEQPCYHMGYQIGGTPDLVAVLKGDSRPAVLDIKTSKAIYPVMALQTAAYREMINSPGQPNYPAGLGVTRRYIVRLGKEDSAGKIQVKEFPVAEAHQDWLAFQWAMGLWRHFYPNARPKEIDNG